MVLVAVAWLYVALMMALAELVHPNGSALGALVTFVLYGAVPVGLLTYLMATPLRKKARQRAELAAAQALAGSTEKAFARPAGPTAADDATASPPITPESRLEPDAGSHAPGTTAVPPVRKKV
jgi:hypothetical protein